MSEVINQLTISLENLTCSSCKNYLSSAPIQVLTDGNSICGNCSPLYANEATQRVLTLEAILTNFSFPCQFKPHGCEYQLQFGHTNEHEAECKFRLFNCPNNCPWKGPSLQIFNHFVEAHPETVRKGLEFNLDILQDQEELLLVDYEKVKFIFKYVYCAESTRLWYDLKYISTSVEDVMTKIILNNDIEEGYSITLKGNACLGYEGDFLTQNNHGLVLSDFLPVLNKPHRVLITFDLCVTKNPNDTQTLIVDYDLLEKLRCKQCKTYLVPPVYIIEGTAGFLCYNCRTASINCKPLQNNTMIQRWISQANYPCRWRGCKNVEKADQIAQHERSCFFRKFACFADNCMVNFRMNEATAHLRLHHYRYFTDELVYKMSFGNAEGCVYNFSRKCNELVSIRYYTKYYDMVGKKDYLHKIVLGVSSTQKSKIKAKVQFEHAHCKIKSPMFIVKSGLYFGLDKMPGCFKIYDELTVTVKLICDCLNGCCK